MKYLTGIQQLDSMLRGGIPSGVCEVFGEAASGKSTLCFSLMREASLRGLPYSLIHSECYPDKDYILNCGVPDCISIIPKHLEAAFEAADKLLQGGVKLIAIDSITGLESELDSQNLNVGERVPYAQSDCIHNGLRHLCAEAQKRKALVVVTNQLRTPIHQINPKPTSAFSRIMGKTTNTRIRTFRDQTRNEYGELAYIRVKFLIKKSLKSPPGGEAYGFLFNQRGFDPGFEIVRNLLLTGVLQSAGAYFRLPDGSTLGPGYLEAADQVNQTLQEFRRLYGSI